MAEGVELIQRFYDEMLGKGGPVNALWEEARRGASVLLEEAPAGLSLEEAIAWGRARAQVVLVRLFEEWFFSAGAEDPPDQDLPRWPPSPEALAALEAEVRALRDLEARRIPEDRRVAQCRAGLRHGASLKRLHLLVGEPGQVF